jgi:hypothetical protein
MVSEGEGVVSAEEGLKGEGHGVKGRGARNGVGSKNSSILRFFPSHLCQIGLFRAIFIAFKIPQKCHFYAS